MLGKRVKVKNASFEGDVWIVDKVMTTKSHYTNAVIMNEASFDVYLGKLIQKVEEGKSKVIQFKPTDIIKIY